MRSFPIMDWQFWLATLIALAALLALLRSPIARLIRRSRPKSRPHKAALTIEGAPVDATNQHR